MRVGIEGRRAAAVLVALAAALVVAGGAGAAPKYRPAAVLEAFTSHGIKMYDAGIGTSSPVRTFAATKAHHGWRVAAYVYATVPAARRSYAQNLASWKRSGFASTRLKNVIVVVTLNGRTTAKKASAFRMPALVRAVIRTFAK